MTMTATLTRLVRHTLLAAPLALAPVASSVVMQSFGFDALASGSVQAQESAPKYKTKKSYSLRQPVFKDFAKVQEKTDAEDWRGALAVLKSIESSKAGGYTSYEKANLWNYFGWVYYSLDDYNNSIRYYKKVLAESELSEALEVGTLKTLAQLMFVQEDWKGAIKLLKKYMQVNPIIGSSDYALLSQACYQAGDMNCSLKNINIAVSKDEKAGKVPQESWFTLQRAIYYEKGDYKTVVKILIKLIRYYPKGDYWKQLSAMYGALEQEKNQLYALDVAYLMGAVSKESELMNLAYLLMGQDVPYKASQVIQKGMKKGQIKETSKNLEVLATALRLSQEVKDAIPVLEQAAAKSDNGDLYARLAGIYLDSDDNKKALQIANKAIKRGGVKRMDQLQIVIGMANTNLKRYDVAIEAFRKAAKDKRSEKFASQWMQYAQSELEREKSLNL